ncbi:MAG: septum formation protein Maf [Rhodobacteraceae bacterium]|nr:MAG: septum formation protein Maf [Paracoccaceae bacterium]
MFIFASASKARLDLLNSIGIFPEKIVQTNIDETIFRNEHPVDYVTRVALEKNKNVEKADGDLVLSADTIISVGRRILTKPTDPQQARQFLDLMSGRRHKVMTSICVFSKGKYYQKVIKTTLKMKRLSVLEKERYLLSNEWQGKAGGYAIQGRAAYFFPFVSGSYTNIVGLPLTETIGLLVGLGYKLSSQTPKGNS